jgi:hypothetical protein
MADLNDTVQFVRDIAEDAFVDAIDIMRVIETLEASNDQTVISDINATQVGGVADLISRALWARLVGVVARAYTRRETTISTHSALSIC